MAFQRLIIYFHHALFDKYMKQIFLLFAIASFIVNTKAQNPAYIISAPAGDMYTHIDRNGTTVIPNGRILTPAGQCFTVAPHPYGLALSSDGTVAITANSGTSPISITILRNINTSTPDIRQIDRGPTPSSASSWRTPLDAWPRIRSTTPTARPKFAMNTAMTRLASLPRNAYSTPRATPRALPPIAITPQAPGPSGGPSMARACLRPSPATATRRARSISSVA